MSEFWVPMSESATLMSEFLTSMSEYVTLMSESRNQQVGSHYKKGAVPDKLRTNLSEAAP
jgi:hypothetical protein